MNRRELVSGLLSGAAALTLGGTTRTAWAESMGPQALVVTRRVIEVNGKPANVFGLLGPGGLPGLRFSAGDRFDVSLQNQTDEATIMHWHGLTPPWQSDGVGDAPLPLLGPGEDRAYDFVIDRPGTHWMHAHTLQEQSLLAAPLIVASKDDDRLDEQEVVVLLHDFSFTSPEELLAGLTGQASDNAMGGMDLGGLGGLDMGSGGMDLACGAMAMDLNDIEYDAYLANDRTLDDPEVFDIERGGRVRLRIINGATATAFTIDLGELSGDLIAVDGEDVVPVSGRRFPISMGQRLDIRLQLPSSVTAFPILALREGSRERTGFLLKPSGASVAKLAASAEADGPVLDLDLESRLASLAPLAERVADKTYAMRLTGDMAGYSWGLGLDAPILADLGDRIEVKMTNMSMMAHPMHLHGHHFQVVAIDGKRFSGAVRDTVLVPPMRSVTIAIDANNPGQWAFHCHHLYHMATGMMSTFGYRT